jgi:hypothetical protein
MIAVTSCEKATSKRFHKALKKYLHPKKSSSGAIRVQKSRKNLKKITLGEAVVIPDADLHHVLDADTVLAVTNAIIDLASEVRAGDLIVSLPDFEDYSDYRTILESTAKDLDSVRIWSVGNPPKNRKNIDFIPIQNKKLQRYFLVLFQSEKGRAMLLCQQINSTTNPNERKFLGFYSFNPYLVESIRWRFNLVTCGLNRFVNKWETTFPLPDLRMKAIDQLIQKPKPKALPFKKPKALSEEVSY